MGRGFTPSVMINSKKGSQKVFIHTWVEYVLYQAKQVDDLPLGAPKNTYDATKTAVNSFDFFGTMFS